MGSEMCIRDSSWPLEIIKKVLPVWQSAYLHCTLSLDYIPLYIKELISILYIVIPFCCIISSANTGFFMQIVIGSLILIWTSDISAYFVGKSIGKHKLMPSISPGKTWEGFFGAGMITCIASYILASFYINFDFQTWLLIGLSTWLFGSIGDLVESKIKRKLNIKDSGSILPGHGGFLDRFDGYLSLIHI